MKSTLLHMLKELRLSGLMNSLEVRLQESTSNRLTHAEFLELILQDEMSVRDDRQIERRTRSACFRDQKTLDEFDWDFNRTIRRKLFFDLASGEFVRHHRDVLLVGPPGVGKSHLAQAVGRQLIRTGVTVFYRSIFDAVRDLLHDEAFDGHEKAMSRYLKPDLLILDDMGMKHLPKRSGEYLFEIIMRRHELKSTLMTSNRPLEDWGKRSGFNCHSGGQMKRPRKQRWSTSSTLHSASTRMDARDFGRIKHNFNTSHKRPPGPGADNSF